MTVKKIVPGTTGVTRLSREIDDSTFCAPTLQDGMGRSNRCQGTRGFVPPKVVADLQLAALGRGSQRVCA